MSNDKQVTREMVRDAVRSSWDNLPRNEETITNAVMALLNPAPKPARRWIVEESGMATGNVIQPDREAFEVRVVRELPPMPSLGQLEQILVVDRRKARISGIRAVLKAVGLDAPE